MLALAPAALYAQEAVIIGTVTDSTSAVLPGVTVTAVHQATGNRFVAITDERGTYRIPARVGGYELVVELQGFTTVTRSGLQVLIGQTERAVGVPGDVRTGRTPGGAAASDFTRM